MTPREKAERLIIMRGWVETHVYRAEDAGREALRIGPDVAKWALEQCRAVEAKDAAKDAVIKQLSEALKFYMVICGNTCGHQVSRETAREMHDMGTAALDALRKTV